MPFLNERQFNKHIKDKDFANLYFIYGNEPYLKDHYVDSLMSSSITPGFESFNLHRFNAQGLKKNDALNMLASAFSAGQAVPVMSEYLCVLIKDMALNTFKDKDLDFFKDGAKAIPPSTIIIFHADQTEIPPNRYDPWQAILNFCADHGVVANLNKRSQREIISLISSGVQKRDCKISPKTAEYLIFYSGDNLQILLNEVEKLCAYKGSDEITKETIEKVCIKSVEASAFDLASTIINKDADKAFFILNTLLTQKTEPTIILGTLAFTYVDIYRQKLAEAAKKPIGDLSKLFSYKGKTFRLNKAGEISRRLPLDKVRESINILSQADIDIKSSSKPNQLILEQTLIRLLSV